MKHELIELLVRYEELKNAGENPRPEEICRDRADLLPEFLLALRLMEALPAVPADETCVQSEATNTQSHATPGGDADVARVGRFHIVRFHAQGGLGEVMIARDEELQREVAFKRIRSKFLQHAETRRRFLMEAEITAKLEHPGVVPIYGLVHSPSGDPCYAMRFVQGESLEMAIQGFHRSGSDWNSVEFRQLLHRFVTVCQTVAYAHSRGIIHRDLKPSNILLGKYGETLVVDWGLAKPFTRSDWERSSGEESLALHSGDSGDETVMGQTVGTPSYMPPEQAAGRWNIVGPLSDVYSLGATLYEILTGQKPVRGEDTYDVLAKVQRGDFPRPTALRPNVPKALEAICLRAMALKPEERFASAKDLARDVEHWLADEPVAAYAEPRRVRLSRWHRRHRLVVTSSTVALILLVIGTTLGYLSWHRGEARRADEERQRITSMRLSADAAKALARGEISADRFLAAERILDHAWEQIHQDPALADSADRLDALRRRVHDLVEFYRLSDRSQALEIRLEDDAARLACERALEHMTVWEHERWWEHLPVADLLSPAQRERLTNEVHRTLLFLAFLQAKSGIMHLLDPGMRETFHAVMRSTEQANRYRPTEIARLIDTLALLGLGEFDRIRKSQRIQPSGAVDCYFVGTLYLLIATLPSDNRAVQLAFNLFREHLGPDLQNPLAVAETLLQQSASLDPHYGWVFFLVVQRSRITGTMGSRGIGRERVGQLETV